MLPPLCTIWHTLADHSIPFLLPTSNWHHIEAQLLLPQYEDYTAPTIDPRLDQSKMLSLYSSSCSIKKNVLLSLKTLA